ncbi:MAG: AIR synthase-related protein [Myxococcota bacterium]|nr:AIR synthase-related protein [Myxococcota bacterium]
MAARVLSPGKLPAPLLATLLGEGAPLPAEVRLGPGVGEDACAIQVPAGILVAATDPITLTGAGVGAHAVWINANDVAVMGVRPRWFLAVLLLPPGTRESEVRAVFAETRTALARVGASLVGGHTEVTAAVNQTVVVGQMLGIREDGRFVPTGGLRPGDGVLQVGPAALEGAAVLAAEAPLEDAGISPALLREARAGLEQPGISVVEPALLAAELGARALHDPTEGGLATGLAELADASGVALRIDPERVHWFGPAPEICRALEVDPWGVLASGCLLAGFAPERLASAERELEGAGFEVRRIAVAEPGAGVSTRSGEPLAAFSRDEVARILGVAPRL